MMAVISGASLDYMAWNKWRLGWFADEQIVCVASPGTKTFTLSALGGPLSACYDTHTWYQCRRTTFSCRNIIF